MHLVFNELALSDMPQDNAEAKRIMDGFISCYGAIMKSGLRFSRSIKTDRNLNEIDLNGNFPIAQWRNRTDKDTALAFKAICNRQIVYDLSEDEVELECEHGTGKGLLCAYINGEVAISLASDVFWESFHIDSILRDIANDCDQQVRVPNISKEGHINENYEQIRSVFFDEALEYQTAGQLLTDLGSLFPYLLFHNAAIGQLETRVEAQHVPAIARKLFELNEYFSNWADGPFDPNKFKTKISPESQATLKKYKKQHTFSYAGSDVVVSYHLRYTGNIAGRIYFHPDHKTRKGLICSLTTKLQSVSF